MRDERRPAGRGRAVAMDERRGVGRIRVAVAFLALVGGFVGTALSGTASAAPPPPSFTATGSMASARSGHTATLLPSGKVLVTGGTTNGGSILASAELYDPASGTWQATGSMTQGRTAHRATLLANGRVLVTGGQTGAGTGATATAEIYNPNTGQWRATGAMTAARFDHEATLLGNGRVLVTGGCCVDPQGSGLPLSLASAEIFNPATGTFTATAPMSEPRAGHSATRLADGKVLVAGGGPIDKYNAGGVATAELFDPATRHWQTTGSSASTHFHATTNLLADGSVLVAGGKTSGCCSGTTSADRYDPGTGTWQVAGSMHVARYDAASATLPDGTVIVTGGYVGIVANPVDGTSDVYHPDTNTWTVGPTLVHARDLHTATVLGNGKLLLAGGQGGTSGATDNLASAELLSPARPCGAGHPRHDVDRRCPIRWEDPSRAWG